MRHLIHGIGLLLVLSACGKKDDTFGGGGSQNDYIPDNGDGGGDDGTGGTDSGATGTDTGATGGDTGSTGGDTGSTGGDTGGPTIVGTGYDAGDVAYDLTGTDQTGTPFSLHALYGSDVLLIVGNMDNPSMQAMAAWMGGLSGVTSVAVIGRDEDGVAADVSDAAGWASTYGIDKVIADSGGSLVSTWAESNPPKTYVIDDDMTIYWTHFGTASEVQVEDKFDAID